MKQLSLITILCLIFAGCLFAKESKLSVTGNAAIFKPADKLTMVLGVETYNQDRQTAIEENAVKMKAVMEALNNIGFTSDELQTKDFSLIPQMTPAPKNPPLDWQPKIAGYEVRNTLRIQTTRIEDAGLIIDTAAKVGSNTIQNLNFSLKSEEPAKIEAIGKAFNQAESYAKALADDARLKLGNIIEISIGQPYVAMKTLRAENFSAENMTPITARDIEITASVSVIYELEN